MSTIGPADSTAEAARGESADGFLGLLRAAALIATMVGAVGSVGLMYWVGHRSVSRIFFLLVLFAGWVITPFVALLLVERISKRWSITTRAAIHGLMLVITLITLAIYGRVAFGPPRPRPAAAFLIVPVASWLLMAIVVPLTAWISSKRSRPSAP